MIHPSRFIQTGLILLFVCFIIFFLGKSLNPFALSMFPFHDSSQAARVSEFSFNMQSLQLPPRIAPHFEHTMSYPAFNFYAPFSYWITSFIHLAGIPIIGALKLSFLGAIVTGFLGMYVLGRKFFSFMSSLGIGIMYVTGIYFATNIFVRGNLAEVWYMALLPLSLFMLLENQERQSRLFFVFTSIIISFILTVHTIFSPVTLFIMITVILLQKKKLFNGLALLIGLGLSSYFVIPVVLESSLTYAKEVAAQTRYMDHFLCIGQIWKSMWGFAGSAPGCTSDGMSFMVGKVQIVTATLGIIYFLSGLRKRENRNYQIPVFMLIIFIGAFYMTLYQSHFIWDMFSPVMALFQFPWRFLTLATFGAAFFSGYFFEWITKSVPFKIVGSIVIGIICIYTLYSHSKYFYRPDISQKKYEASYLSKNFIENEAAKKLPEYFPKVGDFSAWKKNEYKSILTLSLDGPYEKKLNTNGQVILPIIYLPYWKIMVNQKQQVPYSFDLYARPILRLSAPSEITMQYEQTAVQKIGNFLTVISFILLLVLVYTRTWSKLKKTKA